MKIQGKVINQKTEKRQLLNKQTGKIDERMITHIVLMLEDGEIVTARTFDAISVIPETGKVYIIPSVKKYENYNGMTSEVLF